MNVTAAQELAFAAWQTVFPKFDGNTLRRLKPGQIRRVSMNAIIYLVGLVVVIMAILSFIGLN